MDNRKRDALLEAVSVGLRLAAAAEIPLFERGVEKSRFQAAPRRVVGCWVIVVMATVTFRVIVVMPTITTVVKATIEHRNAVWLAISPRISPRSLFDRC